MNSRQLFSQACENNKKAISDVLQTVFIAPSLVLEIGSGSGQHASHMAAMLPHVCWQPSDMGETLSSIEMYRQKSGLSNINAPLQLDVMNTPWPLEKADGVFAANIAHIAPWQAVEAMFSGVGELLDVDNYFCLYGPFNYDGQFTSDGNASLDAWAKSIYPGGGIRECEKVVQLAADYSFSLTEDHEMPANNRLLQFIKQ